LQVQVNNRRQFELHEGRERSISESEGSEQDYNFIRKSRQKAAGKTTFRSSVQQPSSSLQQDAESAARDTELLLVLRSNRYPDPDDDAAAYLVSHDRVDLSDENEI
jgi:hypothetical protein